MKNIRSIPVWSPLPWEKTRTDITTYPLSLFQCGHQRQPPNNASYPIIRNNLLIHYVVKGTGTFYPGKQAFKIGPGQAFFVLPGHETNHTSDKDNPLEYYFLAFDGSSESLQANINALGIDSNHPVLTLPSPIPLVTQWLAHVVEQFLEPNENEFRSMGYAFLFLADIAEASPLKKNRVNQHQYIEKIMHYIRVNYSQPLTVEDLSRQFNLSRSHLYRLFKSYTGFSPQQYLINTRIEAAKSHLSSSRHSMKSIAQFCGFRDSMHLSAVFKTYTSISPTEYREQKHKIIKEELTDNA